MPGEESRDADKAMHAAVVRVRGEHGQVAGAGVLVTSDRVLTCAHVVSDALGINRDLEVTVGATVLVDFPLADGAGRQEFTAEVERWIPEEPKHCGDVAVLRLQDPVPGTCPLPMADSDDISGRPVRAVGFPDGEPGVLWHRGELSGKSEGDWIQLSRADIRTAHVSGGFSGSPVWDEQQGAAVGIVVAVQGKQDNSQQAFAISLGAVLRKLPDLARVLAPDPFRGLDTFQESHEEVFFGRDADIEDVVTALKGDHPAVVLYGPSGCGKSSLVLAGVVPRMRREKEKYDAVVVNAGADGTLVSGLATDLYEAVRTGRYGDPRADSVDQVEGWLADKGLVDTMNRLRGRAGGTYIVVLDQAEALLDRGEDEIEQAVRLLFPRGGPGTASRLLVTLRSDFMDAALKHPRLGSLLRSSRTLPLTSMSRDQLREVITKPLEKAPAVAYDPGLAQRILDDACGEPENLPLLGFVLKKLWDDQFAGRLRTTTYEAMHGVSGALEEHCDRAWRECVGESRNAAASRLLRGLVRVLPGSETPLRRRLDRQEAGETGWDLARSFAERRLLVLRGGRGEAETAELAHETLINVWPALREQVREDEEFLTGRAELGYDRDRWTKGAARLPGASQLAAMQNWLKGREQELTREERDFLARARRLQRVRRTRLRAAWTAAALVFALIAGLGTFLVYQSQVSELRSAESRSRALASLSTEMSKQDPGQAGLLAMAAYDVAPTQEARNAILRRYDQFKHAAWVLSGVEGEIDDVATSTDGTVVLATSRLGRAALFIRQAEGRVQRLQLRLTGQAFYPTVSRDGRRIAYVSGDGALVWHDIDPEAGPAGQMLGRAHAIHDGDFAVLAESKRRTSSQIRTVDFSPDAERVVTVTDGRLRLWDLTSKKSRSLPDRVPAVQAVWFGPDGDTLVAQPRKADSGSEHESVVAVDIATGKTHELAKEVHTYSPAVTGVYSLPDHALSGDGGVLAYCRIEGGDERRAVYRTVRVADGRVLSRHEDDSYSCKVIALNETGQRFAIYEGASWLLGDAKKGAGLRKAYGSKPAELTHRLLGTSDHPVVPNWDETSMTGLPLDPSDATGVHLAVAYPALLDDGRTLLAQLNPGDGSGTGKPDTLAVLDAATGSIKAQAKRPTADEAVKPEAFVGLAVNKNETLVADVVARNKIVVRALPSLREVTEITTHLPPVSDSGRAEPLSLLFPRSDELITVSGSWIERWNARDGRRLSKPVNARDLGLVQKNPPLTTGDRPDSGFAVNGRPEPGYVQIMVRGDSTLHAVDLRTGKEDERLRVRVGPDIDRARLDDSGRYAAAKTKGAMLELWSVRPGRRPERVVGPLGPLGDSGATWGEGFAMGFTGRGTEFFVANANSVRFQQGSDPNKFESYDFAQDQFFLAASRDGKVLLRVEDNALTDVFRLDPELWKRHLCDVLGRDLTDAERRGLPSGLPKVICRA
ncbi:trypsin-like peptidase domain-containing protein [Streptomyces sp. H27-C3]|uniref:nSTAND1 domain-containing NTPase n=1 Tax=Streptomyces sp. H27-C3 TaxID=3046305 RepID=UPI0024B92374|nr:trypsin-like peptidase domain-containing protein [Streptomyces sp. H27-C3]MDJ0464440.1 trypsin-like peptidase domain-containing protein [Streptomyces sp. H27-C3]